MASLTRSERIGLVALGVLALGLLAAGSKMAPGASLKVPGSQVEDVTAFAVPPGTPVIGPQQHIGGYTYTPHRYPAACGNDISVLIHRGLSPAALPAGDDSLWMSAPPSEGEL